MNSNNNNTNNSTHISGGDNRGSIFAAGSNEFKGTINNITPAEASTLENLTEKFIEALRSEQIENSYEVIDAVQQVTEEIKKEKVNKLSLKGIISGIDTFMQSVKSISGNVSSTYADWAQHISNIIS